MANPTDLSSVPEELLCTESIIKYIVKDRTTESPIPDRAQKSMPTNLMLKPTCALPDSSIIGVWAKEYIPAGTRFGPMEGDKYPEDQVPATMDRKYFWRVYDKQSEKVAFFVDGKDVSRANWMRYVLPAYRQSLQNLVAYQDGDQIFFLTTKAIPAEEEMTVWYCKEFARRMGYPSSGEVMMERVRQKQHPEKEVEAARMAALERRQEEEREAMETQAAMLALRRPTANGENQQQQVIEIRQQQQRSYQQQSYAQQMMQQGSSLRHLQHHQVLSQVKSEVFAEMAARQQQPLSFVKQEASEQEQEVHTTAPSHQYRLSSECSSSSSSRGPASPHGPDSGYMGSPSHPSLPSSSATRSPSSSPSMPDSSYQGLDLTNNKKRCSPEPNVPDEYNGFRKHKMKMHKSSGSSCSEGSDSPDHRRTPSPLYPLNQQRDHAYMVREPYTNPAYILNRRESIDAVIKAELMADRDPSQEDDDMMYNYNRQPILPRLPTEPLPQNFSHSTTSKPPAALLQAMSSFDAHHGISSSRSSGLGAPQLSSLLQQAASRPVPKPREDQNQPEIGDRGYRSLPFPLEKKDGKIIYRCDTCEKVFGQLSNLKVHIRTHSGERPFACSQPGCLKNFTQLAHLQKHQLVHTGEKPHACGDCGKRFSSTSNLKTHQRLHTNDKPYSCDKCPQTFTQHVHLKLHRRLHNNERPFICSQCNKSYISASGLRTHWKTTSCEPSPGEVELTAERTLIMLQHARVGESFHFPAGATCKLEPMLPESQPEMRSSESPALSEPGSLVMDTDQHEQQQQQSIFTVGPIMNQEERLDLCQTILDTSINRSIVVNPEKPSLEKTELTEDSTRSLACSEDSKVPQTSQGCA